MLKKVTLLILPLILAVGLGWYFRTENEFFVVRDLSIEVEMSEEQEALMSQLKPDLEKELLSLKGKNIWTLGLGPLRKELLNHPWVAEVELTRRFPDKIQSLIRLQPVAFLFLDGQNRIFPILENGQKMNRVRTTIAPVAPILRNNNIAKDQVRMKKLLQLYGEIPFIGPLKKENIASVDLNSVNGLTLNLIKEKVIVHFGEQNIQTKALQVLRVIDYLQSQNQKARVIDASFTKKVLVRPRKRS